MYAWMTIILFLTFSQHYCSGYLAHLGKHEKCIDILKCEPIVRLLSNQIIKVRIYNKVRQAICGFEGNHPKIFCDLYKILPNADSFMAFLESRTITSSTTSTTTTTTTTTTTARTRLKNEQESIEDHHNFHLLEHDICGPVQVEARIYGGTEAGIHEFPWMALVAYDTGENDGEPDFRCGATVINKNHIMTAAHCVTGLPEDFKFVSVRVGEYDLSEENDCVNDDCEKYQDYEIDEVYPHPDYSLANLQNDIALIRLKGKIDFKSTKIRPICLPLTTTTKLVGKTGIVTGWGSTEDRSQSSNVLLKVALPIISEEKCFRAYRDQPFVKLWYKQICAGGIRYKDSCTGDSGGPLQTISDYNGDIRYVQRGIVSFGRRACAVEKSPGVYTSVAHYVHWILDQMTE